MPERKLESSHFYTGTPPRTRDRNAEGRESNCVVFTVSAVKSRTPLSLQRPSVITNLGRHPGGSDFLEK